MKYLLKRPTNFFYSKKEKRMIDLFDCISLYRVSMNLFLSRISSVIKLTSYLYPYAPSQSTSPLSKIKASVSNDPHSSGRPKGQPHRLKAPIQPLHTSSAFPLSKFLKNKFNIDNVEQLDPGLYKQIQNLLLIANACLKVSKHNSLEKRIALLIRILEQCDLLNQQSLQNADDTTLKTLQNNPTKIKLRREILMSIHYLASIFRKSLENILNLTSTLKIIQTLELEYFVAILTVKPTFNANASELSFWDSLKDILVPLIEQIHQNFSTHNPHILRELKNRLSTSNAPDIRNPQYAHRLCKTLISKMRKINYINNLTQRHQGVFLKHFYHDYHPLKSLGGVCVGAIAEWGQRIKRNPLKGFTQSNSSFSEYSQFLQHLKTEQFPPRLFANYSWLGESLFDKNILLYHLHFTRLFREYKIESFEYPEINCEGSNVANALFELLKKIDNPTEPVSVIGITLEATNKVGATINNAVIQPHMMGIAKIALKDKVAYRFMDTDFGEFEFTKATDLTAWLQEYFQFFHYNCKYNRFSFQPMDTALNKHLDLNTDKNILQLLKEQRDNPVATALTSLSADISNASSTPRSSALSPKSISPTALNVSSQKLVPIVAVLTTAPTAATPIIPITQTTPPRSPLLAIHYQNFTANEMRKMDTKPNPFPNQKRAKHQTNGAHTPKRRVTPHR